MFQNTIRLYEWSNPDKPEDKRLVRTPVNAKPQQRYLQVEDNYTGEKFQAHIADLEELTK